ncbi:hypothetical protein LFL97_24595 [Burkholderia sp. JSH-S8]|nr:hypothetical protein LFL97_24595 [Burkholderia sp. JSH-S8]
MLGDTALQVALLDAGAQVPAFHVWRSQCHALAESLRQRLREAGCGEAAVTDLVAAQRALLDAATMRALPSQRWAEWSGTMPLETQRRNAVAFLRWTDGREACDASLEVLYRSASAEIGRDAQHGRGESKLHPLARVQPAAIGHVGRSLPANRWFGNTRRNTRRVAAAVLAATVLWGGLDRWLEGSVERWRNETAALAARMPR